MKLMLFVVCAALLALPALSFRKQKVKVTGKLKCGNKDADGVKVKLVDEDTGPDPDDDLDSGYTNSKGVFTLQGDTRETLTIDPVLKIYHDCNDGIKPCQRKWKFIIPDKYINDNRGIDIGTWNLEVEMDDEDRDCIHLF